MSKLKDLYSKSLETINTNDWVQEGDILFPCNGKVSVTDTISPGIYRVVSSPNPMDKRIGIRYVSPSFDLGIEKIYKTGGEEIQEKIKTTWNNKIFQDKGTNLCTILTGIKGTGKTITAKQLCNHYVKEYPIFIIDSSFDGGIVGFIQGIDFKCILFIDEAEKTFAEDKVSLLKICDGVLSKSPKIVLMTMNELAVDPNILSRPGRVRYIKEFGNLPESTCREVLRDGLIDHNFENEIYEILATLKNVTIDIVQSIIEEVNIYGDLESVKKYMNIDKVEVWSDVLLVSSGLKDEFIPALKELGDMANTRSWGTRYIYNVELKEGETWPTHILDFFNYYKIEGPSELSRKGYVKSLTTDEIGFKNFIPGTHIPNLGIIQEDLGKDWYKIKLDFTDGLSEGNNSEECSELLSHLEELKPFDGSELQTGDTVIAYIYNRKPFTVYRSGVL